MFRRGRLRQKVPVQAPRSIPDHLWDELFAGMGCDRDRALLEFYVSSGARASELLGVGLDDVDWSGQLIYVISKGTRIRQPVPASPNAFRYLGSYLAADGLPDPGQPVWRTRRGDPRPLTYWATRRILQRANDKLGTNWTLHDARHTAAVRMAGDERLTLAEVQTILRHAHLDTTGRYLTARVEDMHLWHSGVRIEEALELTHLSIRQYQRPNGEVIALLVVAPSKSGEERVIPLSAELFAVIAAIVRRHTTDGQTIPLLPRYDPKELQSSAPMPFLFQRKIGTKHEVMSDTTVVNMLKRHCVELAEQHPGFLATSFTPHDFRRLLATELVNSGLPIHIGAALLGHVNLQTTRAYVAVFYEDVVRHYQGFLDRRRQARPTDEYRPVTEPEWLGFEEHFDQRKVELGGCARPYSTPCQHEHACLRCPMININSKIRPRLDEIEVDLLARRARAEAEGWRGEIEGIELTLSFLRQKRQESQRLARIAPVNPGIPGLRPPGS